MTFSTANYGIDEGLLGRDLVQLQNRVAIFRSQYFPGQLPLAAARKVGHEAEELRAAELLATESDNQPKVWSTAGFEAADVLITLIGWCEAVGATVEELVADAHTKMDVNEARKWRVNDDGTASHVE